MRTAARVAVFACVFVLVTAVGLGPVSGPSSAYAAKKIKLNIKGMENYASTMKVKEALNGVKGVRKVFVDFRNERAIVTVKKGTDTDSLISAVKKAGFRAYLASKVDKREKKKSDEDPYKDWKRDDVVGSTSIFDDE